MNKKSKKPRFKIVHSELSDECRRNIEALFRGKRIKADVPALAKEINSLLASFADFTLPAFDASGGYSSERIMQDIRALEKAINGICPATKELLNTMYGIAYPMPGTDKAYWMNFVLSFMFGSNSVESERANFAKEFFQTEKTHLMKTDQNGWPVGLPVPLNELTDRLLCACALASRFYHRGKGHPPDQSRIRFVAGVIDVFERCTDVSAKDTPSGCFDTFLEYLLVSVSNEPEGIERRKLIRSAIGMREDLSRKNSMLKACLQKMYSEETALEYTSAFFP